MIGASRAPGATRRPAQRLAGRPAPLERTACGAARAVRPLRPRRCAAAPPDAGDVAHVAAGAPPRGGPAAAPPPGPSSSSSVAERVAPPAPLPLDGGALGGGGAVAAAVLAAARATGGTPSAASGTGQLSSGNGAGGAGGSSGAAPSSGAPAATASEASSTGSGDAVDTSGYWDLLINPDTETTIARVKSASDASLLRRKGHLKEQDRWIEYIRNMHETHSCEEAMHKMERWIAEHRRDPRRSRLKRIVPTVGSFFTPLKLVDAFHEYDAFFHLSRRRYIQPNFAELRHILNIAQLHASADAGLRLITFDADGTLYADGHHIEQDSEMIRLFVSLMRLNVHVAIVTAAGYPGEAHKFEGRIEGLLSAFRRLKLSPEVVGRFHLMGGECNYLLAVDPVTYRLRFVPDEEWQTPEMRAWREEDIAATLDEAEKLLREGAARLMLPVQVIRKTRSVGVVPAGQTLYEVLEDLAITVQSNLITRLPFCAFNGGNDVFVDVGNKSIGLEALMSHLHAKTGEVLHVGDRFTDSGNDSATRDVCSIVWVANPSETSFFMRLLLTDLRHLKAQRYIE